MSEGRELCPNEGRGECLETRKMLKMPENTGFLGNVVADWLQNLYSICTQSNLNMNFRNAAEESAAFLRKRGRL